MPTQARNRKLLKKLMIDQDLSIAELARRLGHSRESVSRAINQGKNAGVLLRIEEALRGKK